MGKRSRDVSFSPSEDDPLYPTKDSQPPSDAETAAPPDKVKLLDTSTAPREAVMQCSLPPHRATLPFTSAEDFEVHYAKEHTNRCSSCRRNFPTAHFLSLHIDENHNALREALQAKGEKTYACFVEDCDRKCSTPQKRRMHLIDKHMFPKIYNFRIVDNGIDRTNSLLREGQRRRVSTSEAQKESFGHRRRTSSGNIIGEAASRTGSLADGDSNKRKELSNPKAPYNPTGRLDRIVESHGTKTGLESLDVDELARSMSALKFIPSSVLRQQHRHNAAN